MGFFKEKTVEIDFNGKKLRVAKSDAHLFEKKAKEQKKAKKENSKKSE